MWYTTLYVLERHLGSISEVYLSSVERQPPSSSEVGAASRPLRPGFDLGTPGARGRASPTHSLLRGKSPLGLGDPPWAASSASDGALNSAIWYALVCTTQSRGRELGLDSPIGPKLCGDLVGVETISFAKFGSDLAAFERVVQQSSACIRASCNSLRP